MPAQICHALFAEEAVNSALNNRGVKFIGKCGNLFRLGAQGPDLFYHNRRTKPSGLKFGSLLHRQGYGRFVKHLCLGISRKEALSGEEIRAYLLGFLTHPFLDRTTHPFIDFFSGWVDPGIPESLKYFRCHAFFERVLDVLILKGRRGIDLEEYDFYRLIDCGETLPAALIELLAGSLRAAYPEIKISSDVSRRIVNAYRDSRFFYTYSNFQNKDSRIEAARLDTYGTFKRRLALFHPVKLPAGIDFLNTSRKKWRHPCKNGREYESSFIDLYEQALQAARQPLLTLWQVLEGELPADRIEEAVGNEGLGSGGRSAEPCFSPLPLSEMIDGMYDDIKGLIFP